MTFDGLPVHMLDPGSIPDGEYALSVVDGVVAGLSPAAGGGGGGGGSVETVDAAITAALSGIVHDWWFNETSGATVTDHVGSLNLTISGTATRNVAGLSAGGLATTFAGDGAAISTGLGSVPTGSSARCFIAIHKADLAPTTEGCLFSYGANSTRQWFSGTFNFNTSRPNIALHCVTDNPILAAAPPADNTWQMSAWGYRSLYQFVYLNSALYAGVPAAALATAASGNFHVMQKSDGSAKIPGSLDRLLVLNNWPGKRALDRIYRAVQAA